ncbi:DUF4012 domain-containing protein, partial [Patescibacteria group bacterium]|nr:DUF4012 domain-containing protein [Patescibacteria group bacterium]
MPDPIFRASPRSDGAALPSKLEIQLEIVLERDGVPISVAPTQRLRKKARKQEAEDVMEDALSVQWQASTRMAKQPKFVHVQRRPHEPSRFVIRMDGRVSRPTEERREPFHQAMHRWQTPFVEGVSLDAFVVEASDLWLESLDADFFHDQFTPGDAEDAYQESHRGIWSRARAPFIRWQDRPIPALGAPAQETSYVYQEATELNEIEAMPELSVESFAETKPSLRDRWTSWREQAREEAKDLQEAERSLIAETEEVWRKPYLQPSVRISRVLVGFLGAVCLVALPAGAVSWSRALVQNVASVKQSVKSLPASGALTLDGFANASSTFAEINQLTQNIEDSHRFALALAQALPTTHDSAETVQALLDIGQESARAGELLSQGIQTTLANDAITPDERLVRVQRSLTDAQPHLDRVFAAVERIHPESLPADTQAQAAKIKKMLETAQPLVKQVSALVNLALPLIGHDAARTYLILFQNTAERRPSGGFMGSYAELVLDRGNIHKLSIPGGGPYDLRSQLIPRWQPPQPLQLVGGRWEFQDANWDPDFAQTASTVRTFWSNAGQPTLDGVIAVNASILPKLLTLTGPITLEKYNKTVTADTVLFETQKAVEIDYDHVANTPKAFIGDLNQVVLDRLMHLPQNQWPAFGKIFADALDTKEIQVFFSREDEQAQARAFGWTGEWPSVDGFDQLALIGANIAGQKTDQVIQERVQQAITINERGAIQEQISLNRQHDGQAGALFQGANNVEYLRLYMPADAQLQSASGFEVPTSSLFEVPSEHEIPFPGRAASMQSFDTKDGVIDVQTEGDRKVVGGWIQLRPSSERATSFEYELGRTSADMARSLLADAPASSMSEVTDAYVTRLISQSGAARTHQMSITYPATWTLVQA